MYYLDEKGIRVYTLKVRERSTTCNAHRELTRGCIIIFSFFFFFFSPPAVPGHPSPQDEATFAFLDARPPTPTPGTIDTVSRTKG